MDVFMQMMADMVSLDTQQGARMVVQGTLYNEAKSLYQLREHKKKFISELLERLPLQIGNEGLDTKDGNNCWNSVSIDEVPDYVINNASQYLFSFGASKVETLIFIIRQKKFELSTFKANLFGAADCSKITSSARKLGLLRAEFEQEKRNGGIDIL